MSVNWYMPPIVLAIFVARIPDTYHRRILQRLSASEMDCTRPGNCVAAAWISAVTSAKLLTKAGQAQVLHNERRHAMSSLKESIHEVRRSEQETTGALRELAGQVRHAYYLSSTWSSGDSADCVYISRRSVLPTPSSRRPCAACSQKAERSARSCCSSRASASNSRRTSRRSRRAN